MGDGYKLCYSIATAEERIGARVVVSENLKEYVLEVKRGGEGLIMAKLVCGGGTLNVVNTPQTGSTQEEKDEFWRKLETEMESIAAQESTVVGRSE